MASKSHFAQRLIAVFCVSLPMLGLPAAPVNGEPITIPVRVRAIENFKVGSDQKRFGKLEYVGGLEMTSSSDALGAMSSIRLAADRQHFLGVMDTGHWYAGRIRRDDTGNPIGIDEFSVAPMLDANGEIEDAKWLVDAEAMAIRGDEVFVGFEREHRIDVFSAENPAASRPLRSIPILIPKRELRRDRKSVV